MAKKKKLDINALQQDIDNNSVGYYSTAKDIKNTISVKTTTNKSKKINNDDIAPIKTTTKLENKLNTNADGYADTGKKLGEYSKVDYENRKNWKVYSKDNKFYFYNERTKKYEPMTNNTGNEMKSADSVKSKNKNDKKQIAPIANQTPFTTTAKNNNIADGKFNSKSEGGITPIIKKQDPREQLNIENRLKLDTSNLDGEQYNQYAGQLKAEQDKNKNKYNKTGNSLLDLFKERSSATATTTSYLLNKGMTKGVESMLDMGATVGSWVADKTGNKETSKKLQNWIKEDRTSNVVDNLGTEMKLSSAENNTIVKRNNIAGKVVEGVGQMAPTLLLGGLGNAAKAGSILNKVGKAASYGSTGLIAGGSGAEEALNENANIDDATKYAIFTGATAIATEWITGGIPGVKGTAGKGIDHLVSKALKGDGLDQASKSLSHALFKAGYRAVGEGTEEALEEVINPFLKNATYSQGETIDWKSVGENAIVGAIVGGTLNMPSTISDVKNSIRNNPQNNIDKNTTKKITENKGQALMQGNLDKTNVRDRFQLPMRDPSSNSASDIPKNTDSFSNNNISNSNENVKPNIFTKYSMPNNKNDSIAMKMSDDGVNEIQQKTRINLKDSKDTKFVSIDEILPLKSNGGYRTTEQVTNLANSIRTNGITSPIELTKNSNGEVIINNGNHRLEIADQLGLKEIPIKFDDSVADYKKLLYNETTKEDVDYIGGEEDGNYRNSKEVQTSIDKGGVIEGSRNDNDFSFKNEGTTRSDDRIHAKMGRYNNRPSGNTAYRQNNTEIPISRTKELGDNSFFDNSKTERNTINAPISKEVKKVNLAKAVKQDSKDIAKTMNNSISTKTRTKDGDWPDLKLRKWLETATESDVVDNKIILEDFDTLKATYEVKSNKKSLEKANDKLNLKGYAQAVQEFNSLLNNERANISTEDIVMGERLVQEAINQNDFVTAKDLIENISIIGTELGQRVQALSVIQRLTPEGQLKLLTKVVQRAKIRGNKAFDDVEITPEMVEKILKTYKQDGSWDQNELNEAVENVKQDIAEQLKSSASDKFNEWRYLSMLGNPKTHLRNIISNVAMKGTLAVKNSVARTIETLAPIENRTKTWRKSSDAVKQFAKNTTIEMKDAITGESKYNEQVSIESKKQVFKNKALDKVSKFNSDALQAEDWFFSKGAFRKSLQEYLTAQGINTEQDINNNPDIITKAKAYALEQAEIATFRQYSWMASQISRIERKNVLTKIAVGSVIPFKKTPINIAKAGVNYSPIGLIKSLSYDAYMVKTGKLEASQMIDNISQGLTGTSLLMLGYALAKAGFLQGGSGDDKESKYDNALGGQAYSIKIGNNTYSLSWLSPIAMPLLEGATMFSVLDEQEGWDMNVITDTLAKTLDPLSEMSFLSSLDDALKSYDSGMGKFKSIFQNAGQSYVSQFFPTMFSQLAGTLDDKKRITIASKNSQWKFGEETIRKIMYKIPGLRNQLEASTDIWGNEIEQADNIVQRAFENFLAPYSKKEDISSNLDKELKRVFKETGENGVIPGTPHSYFDYAGEKYQLSASEHTQYKKTYGQTANAYLNELISNSNYQNATNEQKSNMIQEMFKYASSTAKEEYFSDKDIEYESTNLSTLNNLKDMNMSNSDIAEYTSINKLSSDIKNDDFATSSEKKNKIAGLMSNANLTDEHLAYLYGKFYSSKDKLDIVLDAQIPMKEYIKFDSQGFDSEYDNNGKTIKNSKKNSVIRFVNSLNLSASQKAMLIKSKYSSFKTYDDHIMKHINGLNIDFMTKAKMVKEFGFSKYDKSIINYVKNNYSTIDEQTEVLENLGFKIYKSNGKTFVR